MILSFLVFIHLWMFCKTRPQEWYRTRAPNRQLLRQQSLSDEQTCFQTKAHTLREASVCCRIGQDVWRWSPAKRWCNLKPFRLLLTDTHWPTVSAQFPFPFWRLNGSPACGLRLFYHITHTGRHVTATTSLYNTYTWPFGKRIPPTAASGYFILDKPTK